MDVDFKRKTTSSTTSTSGVLGKGVDCAVHPRAPPEFGYEEGPDGELVQQMRVDEGYDGTKMSMPGPSDYQTATRQR